MRRKKYSKPKRISFFTWLCFILFIVTVSQCQECKQTSKSPGYRYNYEDYVETQYAEDVRFNHINKSTLGDTKFINKKLLGKNVLEIPISPTVIDALSKYYQKYIEPFLTKGDCNYPLKGIQGYEFFCSSPPYWKSDIQWIQVNSLSAYNSLYPYFEEMGLNEIFSNIIDVDEKIVIYTMQYVVRSRAPGYTFHIDFHNTTNVNGFTLLTPIQERSKINLAYIDMNKKIQQYKYKKGVGIVFGENFRHGTDITSGDNEREAVFCFSFGTDKMRDWEIIKRTASIQGLHYMHPVHGFSNVRLRY